MHFSISPNYSYLTSIKFWGSFINCSFRSRWCFVEAEVQQWRMSGVFVDTRIYRAEHSLGDVPEKYFPGGSQRACPGWRDEDPYNYANVTSAAIIYMRAGQTATMRRHEKKKGKDDPSSSKRRARDREWRRVVIYDGDCKRPAELFIRRDISRLFLRPPRSLIVKKPYKMIALVALHSHDNVSVYCVHRTLRDLQLTNVPFEFFDGKKTRSVKAQF